MASLAQQVWTRRLACWLSHRSCMMSMWPRARPLAKSSSARGSHATTPLIAEAQQKRAEVLQELGSERSLLQKEIEELRTFERDHRMRLKSYLEGQLIELEQTGADQTDCCLLYTS